MTAVSAAGAHPGPLNGVRVLDWKSDDVTDRAWAEREPAYLRQVSLYAEMVRGLTGIDAAGELVRVASA